MTVDLSVSSNGSEWVKPRHWRRDRQHAGPFSILKRIGVGETGGRDLRPVDGGPFSILKRIGVGET